MTAESIAKALGGHRAGATWMARCPAHEDRVPSLSISSGINGKVLVRCHAGCDQRDVIVILRQRGLWETTGRVLGRFARKRQDGVPDKPDADALKRSEAAFVMWQASRPVGGTHVATYLRSRGLNLPASPALRFHAGLKHPSGGVWPAMVALVTRGGTGSPIAIHRSFLARDGDGKAPVDPAKMMLGPCRGGVVRLMVRNRFAVPLLGCELKEPRPVLLLGLRFGAKRDIGERELVGPAKDGHGTVEHMRDVCPDKDVRRRVIGTVHPKDLVAFEFELRTSLSNKTRHDCRVDDLWPCWRFRPASRGSDHLE